jgi:hypothetical protein
VQNQFLARLQEFAITGAVVWLFVKKKVTLKSPLIFLAAIYLVVTSVNGFVQSRYDYPLYALFCLELARRKPKEPLKRVVSRDELISKPKHDMISS